MQIPKDKILEMLQQQGDSDKADQAKQELPDQSTPTSTPTCCKSSASTPRSCCQSSAATSPASEPATSDTRDRSDHERMTDGCE